MANFTGNGTKSLHTSLKASLKNLDTDYIDLLYVHWWDFSVSVSRTSITPRVLEPSAIIGLTTRKGATDKLTPDCFRSLS